MSSGSASDPRWREQRYLYWLAQVLLTAVVCLAVYSLWRLVGKVVAPMLVSLLLAYLLDPLVTRLQALRLHRVVAIAGVALALLIFTGILAVLVIPLFVQQLQLALIQVPALLAAAQQNGLPVIQPWLDQAHVNLAALAEQVRAAAESTAVRLLRTLKDSAATFMYSLLIPVFVFYFLKDFPSLKRAPMQLVPARYHGYVLSRARQMDEVVGQWLRGQAQVAAVLALLYAVGLWLAGVKLGFVIGLVTGLFNVVPYVGATIGVALSILMVVLEHEGLGTLAFVAVVFVAVQALDAYWITPRLVGSRVGLSPVGVIVALLMGGALFGFVGMFLAVPTTAALGVLVRDAMAVYRRTTLYTGGGAAGVPPGA